MNDNNVFNEFDLDETYSHLLIMLDSMGKQEELEAVLNASPMAKDIWDELLSLTAYAEKLIEESGEEYDPEDPLPF